MQKKMERAFRQRSGWTLGKEMRNRRLGMKNTRLQHGSKKDQAKPGEGVLDPKLLIKEVLCITAMGLRYTRTAQSLGVTHRKLSCGGGSRGAAAGWGL